MKIVRFLIIALFVLSVSLSAAPARAAGPSTGFLALVTQARPNMPLAAQAQMEFNRLAPALMAAKQSGYLLDFQPEFRAGILKLRFSGASVAPMAVAGMMERPVYGSIHEAVAAVPHQPMPTERVSAAVTGSQFNVQLFSSCFGADVPLNSHVIATLKDGAGNLKAKAQFNEQDDGYAGNGIWECFDWSSYSSVVPGWKVTFKVYDTYPGGTLLETRTATAPAIKFTSLTKSTAVVAGTGPANKAYDLYFSQDVLNAANDWIGIIYSGIINGSGAWSRDVYTGSMRGGAWVWIDVHQSANITFGRGMNAPYIFCQMGGNYCSIDGFAFQTSQLKVTHSGTTYTFNSKFDAWGSFAARLETASGAPIIIKAGDQVQGTSVALYTLPNLVINPFDFANDIVSGKVPANRYFNLGWRAYSSSIGFDYWYWKGSNATGDFILDTTSFFDLLSTETSEAEIYYIDKPTGNTTDLTTVYGP
jgi:hypothetical protein